MVPLAPFDLDTVLVAIVTGVVSFIVANLTSKAQVRNATEQANKTKTETEQLLRDQLEETDRRLNGLSHTLSDELQQRRKAEAELYQSTQRADLSIAYVRALGHWLNAMCKMLDKDWLDEHPKPKLPDEIRDEIQTVAAKHGLNVDKFDVQE